jgi:hypothetical protein
LANAICYLLALVLFLNSLEGAGKVHARGNA